MLEVKSDKLADLKLEMWSSLVRVFLLLVFGSLEAGFRITHSFIEMLREVIWGRNVCSRGHIQR